MLKKIYEFANRKIKYQLFILFALLNLGILIFMYFTVTRILSHHLLEEKYESMAKENIYIESLLDQYIHDSGKSSLNYYYSKEMLAILSAMKESTLYQINSYSDTDSLKLFLTGIIEMNADTESVYLFALNGNYVYGLSKAWHSLTPSLEASGTEEWFLNALNRHGKNVILGKTKSKSGEGDVLSMCRAIINPDNYKAIGVVYIEFALEGLERLFHSSPLENTNCIIITDSQDQLIYINDEKMGMDILNVADWNRNKNNNYWLDGQKSSYYLVSRNYSYTNWNIYSATDRKSLYYNIQIIQNIFKVCMLISIIVTFIVSYFYSSFLSNVLHNIIAAMKEFENGNLHIQLKINGTNEINQLKSGFNSLITRIQQLIEEEYKIKILNKEIEVKLLRQQINPHFLYNTLGMISNHAEKEGAEKTSRMCIALAELFRYNLGKEGDISTLREELHHIQNYLSIQEERYKEKLTCFYEISEKYQDLKLPRMTLQPLVENAIIHGIEAASHRCCIIITVRETERFFILSIENTGKTLSSEQVAEINQQLQSSDYSFFKEPEKIGVYNVNSRLQYYLPGSGLHFLQTNIGAKVEILLAKERTPKNDV